jgi:hypothetical protein
MIFHLILFSTKITFKLIQAHSKIIRSKSSIKSIFSHIKINSLFSPYSPIHSNYIPPHSNYDFYSLNLLFLPHKLNISSQSHYQPSPYSLN